MSAALAVRCAFAALALAASRAAVAQDVSLDGCDCLHLSIAEPWRSGPAASDSVERPASALFSADDSLPRATSRTVGTSMRHAPHLPPVSILMLGGTAVLGAAVLAHRPRTAARLGSDA